MMGFSPSFFRFLFMAAAAFAVVAAAEGALLLLPLEAVPVAVAIAGVTDGASTCCLGCGCILQREWMLGLW